MLSVLDKSLTEYGGGNESVDVDDSGGVSGDDINGGDDGKVTANGITVVDGVGSANGNIVTNKITSANAVDSAGVGGADGITDANGIGGAEVRIKSEKIIERLVTEIFEKPSECHFTREQNAVCSPTHVVNKMAEFAKNKGVKIDSNPVKIVGTIKEMMNCNSESCVIKNPEFIQFAKIANVNDLLDRFFKPNGPATHFGLLSNFNIDDVLDQLEQKFPGFLHIPFQMRDFEKIGTDLATVDLAEKFRKDTKSFGVVLNTDWSSGPGIHWYCIFGEKKNGKIILEYFNSSGREPLTETQAWLQKTKHYLQKELKIPVEVKYSSGVMFQNDEHSCGVYCLMYIWLRLEGVPNNWFKTETFNDDIMHKARKVLFRHEV